MTGDVEARPAASIPVPVTLGAENPGQSAPIVQLGIDCVPTSGGTYTLMKDFRRALQAPIVSVTAAGLVPADEDEGILHVAAGWGPLAQGYRVPARAHPHTRRAEKLLASAGLIIIHGLFRHPTGWGYGIARKHRIPFWVIPHGSLDPWVFGYRSMRKHMWMATVGRRLLRDARFVITASPLEERKAAEIVDGAFRRLVVPWPVEPHRAAGDGRSRVREGLGIPPDARVLVSLGRLHPEKGIPELIRAVTAAAAPELHLILVGPDSPSLSRDRCAQLAAAASDRIHVVGPAWGEERFAYLEAADGFVSLSHRESFGYAAAEAMAAGKPVIVSRESGIASALPSGVCGWRLEGDGEEEARAAIESFRAASADALARLGAAARAWVLSELSFARFQARLQDAVAASGVRRLHAGMRAAGGE